MRALITKSETIGYGYMLDKLWVSKLRVFSLFYLNMAYFHSKIALSDNY